MSTARHTPAPVLWFHNVLFALDFSPGSLLALPFAVNVAAHYRGKLFISHISSTDEDASRSPLSRALLEKLELGAEKGLLGTLNSLDQIPHEFLFNHGGVRSTLMAVAAECRVDLIVIGTHGWRGIRKLLRGSTAEEIACLATRPVLTVGPKVQSQPQFTRILYVTSTPHVAVYALLSAFSIAHAYGASVLLLYATETAKATPGDKAALNTVKFLRDELRACTYGDAAETAQVVVKTGPVHESILRLATTENADLIVVGLHQSGGIRARIAAHLPGSTIYEVISQAPCPVLTVPAIEFEDEND